MCFNSSLLIKSREFISFYIYIFDKMYEKVYNW